MKTDRFFHEGRPLESWLLQLVADSSSERRAASRTIRDRFYRPMDLVEQPETDWDAILAEFNSAVRQAVNGPAFPAADYVQKLFSLSMSLEAQRMGAWDTKNKEEDVWHEGQAAKLGSSPTEAEVRRYVRRACIRLRRDLQKDSETLPDEAFETGFAITYVIESLGAKLLPAAPLIRHMLKETHQAYIASAVICRMELAAKEFYPDLIAGLEEQDPNSEFSKPLGILLRHDPSLVEEVLKLTGAHSETVRINAIKALGHCGREVLKRHPRVEASVRELLQTCSDEVWFSCVWSLGEIAATSDTVSLLLQNTYPGSGGRAGMAISSLGRIGMEADRVVPRLIALLDEFSEHDPDWTYTGQHSRVIAALEAFGSDSRPAIPALVGRVWMPPEKYYDKNDVLLERPHLDKAIVAFLGSHGAAAKESLPVLLNARAEMMRRGMEDQSSEELDGGPTSEEELCPEFLRDAIKRIQNDQ